jgi:hypothetical protein
MSKQLNAHSEDKYMMSSRPGAQIPGIRPLCWLNFGETGDRTRERQSSGSCARKAELRVMTDFSRKVEQEVPGLRRYARALTLGIPVDTVRSRLSRGRESLRRLMGFEDFVADRPAIAVEPVGAVLSKAGGTVLPVAEAAEVSLV